MYANKELEPEELIIEIDEDERDDGADENYETAADESDEEAEEATPNSNPDVSELEEGLPTLLSFFNRVESKNEQTGEVDVEFVPLTNIAEVLPLEVCRKVGQNCMNGYDADWASMDDWRVFVDAGLELVRQETKGRSDGPWDGSSNFKSPILQSACLKLADRAQTEMLRKKDLVYVNPIGAKDEAKEAQAKRVGLYLNFQFNEEMCEWRDEHEKLMYDLPYIGCGFKKTFFNGATRRPESRLIVYPNFAVDNNVHSIERLRRFSEPFDLPHNDVLAEQAAGNWLDIPLDNVLQEEDNNNADTEAEADKITSFIAQEGWFDLDGDGYEEPYEFITHVGSQTAIYIVPRYELDEVMVKVGDEIDSPKMTALEFALSGESPEGACIISIKPKQQITKYGLFKDPQGGFLDLGFSHLLGGYTEASNAITNQLVDSGTLANLQGGLLAKECRTKMGEATFRPGVYRQTGISAEHLRNAVLPHQFKEPSGTLFQLMQFVNSAAQDLSSSADLKGALSAQAPATTTLALVQDQEAAGSALIMRLFMSLTKEIMKIAYIDARFVDPEKYKSIVNDPEADFKKDFDFKALHIAPTANPELSSKMQRLQQAQALMNILSLPPEQLSGIDTKPIIKSFMEALNFADADKVIPELDPLSQVTEIFKRNPDVEKQIMGEKEFRTKELEMQKTVVDAEQKRQNILTQSEVAKNISETDVNDAKIGEIKSGTLLNLEKATRESGLAKQDGATQNYAPLIESPEFQAPPPELPQIDPNLGTSQDPNAQSQQSEQAPQGSPVPPGGEQPNPLTPPGTPI